ncbi:complement factor H-like [Crotalus adamanteus]|uniref:Complement factor H-like n=1 Tax=Crotalus adamanteus TaxID=8729 RepID=A0AAW1BNU5_CROAD
MKGWLLLATAFFLWPGCSSQNECEEPDEIDFGEIVSTEKAKYLENDRVQYRCNPGYVLEGPEWIQCKAQEWTPHPPKCLTPCSITRQQLAAKKLFVFGNQRKARLIQSNHSLQFQCNEGYVLVAPSVRKCVDGYMDLPLCISERGGNCSSPPRIENGDITTLSEKQYRSGSSVEFRCQRYYAMEGQNRSFCDNGAWTKAPICLDPCVISRTDLERQMIQVKDGMDAPENIFLQRDHSIELICKTGYVLAANSSQSVFVLQCDGTSPVIPKCKEITCNSPRILNGSFRPQRTTYHDGDLIRIQCDSGFIFEPTNGEKVVECTKNGWSPSPKCVNPCVISRTDLERQMIQVKDGMDAPENIFLQHGQSIELTCKTGYVLVANSSQSVFVLQCDGTSPVIPKCKDMQCFPPEVTNGHFRPRQAQYTYNDEIETICDEGFFFGGPGNVSKCIKSGWNPPVVCKSKVCEYIRIENGKMTDYLERYKPFPIRHRQTIQFLCSPGFLAANKQNRWQTATCIDSRYVPEPKCFKACDPSQYIYYGGFIYTYWNTYIEGDNITFACNKGYSPANQQPTVTCTKRGWSPPPRCIVTDATCPEPPTVENAEIEEDTMKKYVHGEKINYQCNDGFEISGSAAVTCTEKKWSHLPNCEDVRCSSPPQIQNGRIVSTIKEMYLPQEKVQYRCNPRYALLGSPFVKCLKKRWSQAPRCSDIGGKCGRPPPVENGDITDLPKANYFQSESVTYQCQNLYTMEGSSRVTCHNGHWSQTPTCRAACTVNEEDKRQHNIRLKWSNGDKIYSADGNIVEFECIRRHKLHPNSGALRVNCVNGKFDYPHCIPN